jgi:hypothetical protein
MSNMHSSSRITSGVVCQDCNTPPLETTLRYHRQYLCTANKVTCNNCKRKVIASYLRSHQRNHCKAKPNVVSLPTSAPQTIFQDNPHFDDDDEPRTLGLDSDFVVTFPPVP